MNLCDLENSYYKDILTCVSWLDDVGFGLPLGLSWSPGSPCVCGGYQAFPNSSVYVRLNTSSNTYPF